MSGIHHSGVGPRLRLLPAGDRGILLAPDEHKTLSALVDALRRNPPSGVQDILPAAQTVLVTIEKNADRRAVEQGLRDIFDATRAIAADAMAADAAEDDTEVVSIVTRYDGEDLGDVAGLLGIGVDEVIAAHTSGEWRCAFIGFAPGFGYLESTEAGLAVPRRAESRTAVPAGAVALADGYCAVYPRRSPGGWQIIGTTDAQLWDINRPQPALLQPGTRVRFVDEDAS